jgi:hypothetical protein
MLFVLQGISCSAQSLIIVERFPVAAALWQWLAAMAGVAVAGRPCPHVVRPALLPDRRPRL